MYKSQLKGRHRCRHRSWAAKSLLLASCIQRNCSTGSSQKSWFTYSSISVNSDSVNKFSRKYYGIEIHSFNKWHGANIHYPYIIQVYQPVLGGLPPNLIWPVDNRFCSFGGSDNNTMAKISFNAKHVFRVIHVKSIVYIWKALSWKHSESVWLSKNESEMSTSSNFSLKYWEHFSSFILLSLSVI